MPGAHAFPAGERLRRSAEFNRVFKRGRRAASSAFVCYAVREEGQGRKLGLAVSRKVGGAVTRNAVKRRIREAYRAMRPQLRPDAHIVCIAKPKAAALGQAKIQAELRALFQRAELLHA